MLSIRDIVKKQTIYRAVIAPGCLSFSTETGEIETDITGFPIQSIIKKQNIDFLAFSENKIKNN
jgi:hypothetical protein